MGIELDGAVALVTGASSGIGRATAEALAAAGATVAVTARRADRLAELVSNLPGSGHVSLPMDLRADGAPERLVEEAFAALGGRLDVVVNNAAAPLRRRVTDLAPGDVEAVTHLDYHVPVRIALASLPVMLAAGRGSQVFVSSLGGRLPIKGEAGYCGAKAALCGFAEAMAVDLHSSPVDVRLVLPGPIDTEIWDQPGNDPAGYDGPLEPPSVVADAIVAAVAGDAFEVYAPDLKAVATMKHDDPDAYIALAAAL